MEIDFGILQKKQSKKKPLKEYRVNSFESIGWPDPCPGDHTNYDSDFLKNQEDLVYPKERYLKEYSPIPIYIPNE